MQHAVPRANYRYGNGNPPPVQKELLSPLPGFAKFTVKKKAARKARKGTLDVGIPVRIYYEDHCSGTPYGNIPLRRSSPTGIFRYENLPYDKPPCSIKDPPLALAATVEIPYGISPYGNHSPRGSSPTKSFLRKYLRT